MLTAETIAHFPAAPGVYLMKDAAGTVLYVGKARHLRNRVRSYFGTADGRYQIPALMNRVAAIDFIITDTEKEALILENTLIKGHRPRYNIELRDDKTYFSLRMDPREEFPRLSVIRKVKADGARYFGPYASASAAREVLNQLYRIFPLRHYPLETCRRRKRPCLFYEIRQCSGPCHGRISQEDYSVLAEGVVLFLEGRNRAVIELLKKRMSEAATGERFEEAARFRDLIRAIETTLEKQKMVLPGGEADILGFCRQGNSLEVALLFLRGGRIIGSRTYTVPWELDDAEGVGSFLLEYYRQEVVIPEETLLPIHLEDAPIIAELLSEKKGRKVAVATPRRGVKRDLVLLAVKNAVTAAADRRKTEQAAEATLEELRQRLHLPVLPRLIECYDISLFQGDTAVGSRVAFRDCRGEPKLYRHYRIRSVSGTDDFAMMREVLTRRFRSDSAEPLPDLIIVDGGAGQLNILTAVLRELGIEGIAASGLAKSRVEREATAGEITRSDERVFLPGRKNPVVLRQNSAPLLLLARIRDEAHRFAITYHQKLRGRKSLRSPLDDIPGIGSQRKKELLRRFGSLKKIREASIEELREVRGISEELAGVIRERLGGGTAAAPGPLLEKIS
jgi:excinuclease ABC subunit C